MSLEKQKIFQSNKTAEEREMERKQKSRAYDRARYAKKKKTTKAEDFQSSKTAEEREIERKQKISAYDRERYARKKKATKAEDFQSSKTVEEREMERKQKISAYNRARYPRKKTTKAEDSRMKTLEERIEIMRENHRCGTRRYLAKKKESPEEWEAYKEKERARGRARYAKKKEACITGIEPSKAMDGIKSLTPLEWYKKQIERKKAYNRVYNRERKKAPKEQQTLKPSKTAEEREMERRERKRAYNRAYNRERKKAPEEQQTLKPSKTAEEREMERRERRRARYAKEKKAREEQKTLKPSKAAEEKEMERRARRRAQYKEKKAREEQQTLKPSKIAEEREMERRKRRRERRRARYAKEKKAREEQKILQANKTQEESKIGSIGKKTAGDRALDEKNEDRKKVCETLVVDEVKDLLSDLIKRVDAKRMKEASKITAPVTQIISYHNALKDDLKKTEVRYIRKSEVAVIPSCRLKEIRLSLYRSNYALRDEQIERNSRIRIMKELKGCLEEKSQIERKSQNVLVNCASRAEKKSETNPLEVDSSKNKVAVSNKNDSAIFNGKKVPEKKFAEEREIEKKEKQKETFEKQQILEPNKTPEEREIEMRAKDRAKNQAPAAERKKAREERRKLEPPKTLEGRRETIRAREEIKEKLNLNKIIDEKSEKRRTKDLPNNLKKKEASKMGCETVVEDDVKDLVSDLVKRVGYTLEEGSGDPYAKKVKEDCKTAVPVQQILAGHDYAQNSDLKERTKMRHIKIDKVVFLPSSMLKEFRQSTFSSNHFSHDELMEFNRINIEKEIESYLERKAQIERKSKNLLVNCASPDEQNSKTDSSEGDNSKSKVAVSNKNEISLNNKNEIATSNKNEIAVSNKNEIATNNKIEVGVSNKNKIAVCNKNEVFSSKDEIAVCSEKKVSDCNKNEFAGEREVEKTAEEKEKDRREKERREKKRICDKARYARRKKAREEEQVLQHSSHENEFAEKREIAIEKTAEEKEKEKREKRRARDRASYARRKKAREEQQVAVMQEYCLKEPMQDLFNMKALDKQIKRDKIKSMNELEKKDLKNAAEQNCNNRKFYEEREIERRERKRAYERARCASRIKSREKRKITMLKHVSNKKKVAEQNCERDPLEDEKPILHSPQPVTLQMEMEVEPQPIEEPLFTYVKKEIEPLMPYIDEDHSQPMKIKTDPDKLLQREESLLTYVKKEFMHSMPSEMDDGHSMKIKTETEELQQIEESLLNYVNKELVPFTPCIEEYKYSDSMKTYGTRKTSTHRKNSKLR